MVAVPTDPTETVWLRSREVPVKESYDQHAAHQGVLRRRHEQYEHMVGRLCWPVARCASNEEIGK